MTLLDTITKATAAVEAGEFFAGEFFQYPIILNSDEIFPNLKPDSETNGAAPLISRVSGWSITETDLSVIKSMTKFSKSLKKKLKHPRSLDRVEFLRLFNSFLRSNGANLGVALDPVPSDLDFTRLAIEKLGFLICGELAALILDGCVVLEFWELLEILIVHGVVSHLSSANLIEKLMDKNQVGLLCLCVKNTADLRPSELLAVLRFFLSPSRTTYSIFSEVKKQWERQAFLAFEKATKKGLPKKASAIARKASILLMLAHDGFSSSESCLHYVFSTSNVDSLIFSSAISRLNGKEVLSLIRYLGKWLKKYERYPEAGPCPRGKSILGLSNCESVPSFDSVLKALSLILDEHFSYLVLNSDFHGEVRDMQKIVNGLISEADGSSPVDEIVRLLRSNSESRRASH
ncbi:hypothetical protein AXF42_Ash005382 [Apostasia shenzhenica]|uniref:Uncharacterized protein n=1 Tax=Apostasia shenzhenica TaxID=1088818 RepID=A0A2I0B6Q7_9ASPA|nr:hypothetical protein AXF42_Ash005382 [Apostasia shenzhenica]